jgi:hypothetical protein
MRALSRPTARWSLQALPEIRPFLETERQLTERDESIGDLARPIPSSRRIFVRRILVLAIPLLTMLGGVGFAQSSDDVPLPVVPYTSNSFARFFPVAKDVIVPPGGHVVQVLNVFGFNRAAVNAVAHSTIGTDAFHVRIGFGPPHVAEPGARIDMAFADADTARASEITPIKGPRMSVVLDNERSVPVTVSVGVYATN